MCFCSGIESALTCSWGTLRQYTGVHDVPLVNGHVYLFTTIYANRARRVTREKRHTFKTSMQFDVLMIVSSHEKARKNWNYIYIETLWNQIRSWTKCCPRIERKNAILSTTSKRKLPRQKWKKTTASSKSRKSYYMPNCIRMISPIASSRDIPMLLAEPELKPIVRPSGFNHPMWGPRSIAKLVVQ